MTNLAQRLAEHHGRSPDRVAVVLQHSGREDLPVTYRQLAAGAASWAQAYERASITPGEVILLVLQHGEELLNAFWGAVLHGAIPSIMPFLTEKLAPDRYRADLGLLVSVTRPAAVVTYPEFEGEIRAALAHGTSVRAVLRTDGVQVHADAGLAGHRGLTSSSDEIVLLQHSSGTTGLQKGIALSHRAVSNQLDAYSRVLELRQSDVIVSWLPLYHDMGLIAGFVMPIITGLQLVLSSPFDWVRAPYRLMRAVSKYRGSLTWLPNFAYNFCAQRVRDRDLEGMDLSAWRAVINCSEPVRPESHAAFFEKFKQYGLKESALHTSYAMAENVFAVTQSDLGRGPRVETIDREAFMTEGVARPPVEGRPAMRMMSSGRVLPNVQLRILGEHGREMPDGGVGEVAIQSDCMLSGYYNRPDLTEKALLEGWFLTGDYGFVLGGEVFVSGRKKDLIIVGGRNVYPQDLEALSYEVPGVHAGRSVAFGMFDESQGTEEVVIIAEVDSDDPHEHQRIADAIRQHLTRNSAIALRHVKVVGPKWILKTSSGKTARAANREKYFKELAETGSASSDVPATSG